MAERITQNAYFAETSLANFGESPCYSDRGQVRYPMPTDHTAGARGVSAVRGWDDGLAEAVGSRFAASAAVRNHGRDSSGLGRGSYSPVSCR
jgi:hypothetical protein